MLVPQLLLESLEDLREYDFKGFKFYLAENVLDGCDPIRQSHLENASRVQTARKMIESYGEESAVEVTVKILRLISRNDTADELESRYAAGKPATPAPSSSSSSSAVAPPAAPAAMTAQHGSVIIAPNVTGDTSGAWNITINQ